MGKHARSKCIRIVFTLATVLGAVSGAHSLGLAGEALDSGNYPANCPADRNLQNAIGNAVLPGQTNSQEIGTEDEQRRRTEFRDQTIVWVKAFRRRIVPVIILGYVVVGILFVLRAIVNQLAQP